MKRPVILAVLLLGTWHLAVPMRSASQVVSVERLMTDVSVLAHDSMQGRAPGTPGSDRARIFLSRSMSEAGLLPFGDFERPFTTPRRDGVNLVGWVAGSEPDGPVIVLTAHYDHEGVRRGVVYNGADDNASGVAAALEIARNVKAHPLRNTLIVALVDAEEDGMIGSAAFVRDPPVALGRVALNVNLDMVARTNGLLWAGGAHHTPLLRAPLLEVAANARVTLRLGHDRPGAEEGPDWTNSSDHASFHRAGIPYVYFGVEDHEDYHRPSDDAERIDPDEFLASVETILTALRALDQIIPPLPARSR